MTVREEKNWQSPSLFLKRQKLGCIEAQTGEAACLYTGSFWQKSFILISISEWITCCNNSFNHNFLKPNVKSSFSILSHQQSRSAHFTIIPPLIDLLINGLMVSAVNPVVMQRTRPALPDQLCMNMAKWITSKLPVLNRKHISACEASWQLTADALGLKNDPKMWKVVVASGSPTICLYETWIRGTQTKPPMNCGCIPSSQTGTNGGN